MTAITKTNAGLALFKDGISGANNPQVLYIALGSSSVTPTATDTRLGNETFRKRVTSYTNGAGTGEILISCYIAPGDAVGANIQEIGIFSGNSATSAANTGILVAHGLYAHNPKTSLESITIQIDLQFS